MRVIAIKNIDLGPGFVIWKGTKGTVPSNSINDGRSVRIKFDTGQDCQCLIGIEIQEIEEIKEHERTSSNL